MTQLPAWSPFFTGETRMKGRSLDRSGKVELRRDREADGPLISARVTDQDGKSYEVEVTAEGRHAVASCECTTFAAGVFCRHLWGALVALEQADGAEDIEVWNRLTKLMPRPPRAKRREDTSGEPMRISNEPEWVGRLSLVRPPTTDAESAASVFPAPRQVCYVVLPGVSSRHGGLVVEVRQRQSTATGWSRSKPLRVSPQLVGELENPADRELCALLLGAAWVSPYDAGEAVSSTRGHSMFRLPSGSRRRALKEMIHTGRAWVDADDGQGGDERPLRWDAGKNGLDEPWVLWLVARMRDDDSALDVELQGRREGKRMAVSEPLLVLGGTDGVILYRDRAAAFDDRDSGRWVTQFRDGRYLDDDDDGALEVPAADIPRFLERLYLLPNLPELDLPDELTRSEVQLKPQPRLEVFSRPTDTQGLELPPSLSKTHVAARVRFQYGEASVRPGQPGRFINATGQVDPQDADPSGSAQDGSPVEPAADAPADTELEAASVEPSAQAASAVAIEEAPQADTTANGADPETTSTADADAQAQTSPETEDTDPVADTDSDAGPGPGAALIRRHQRSERQALALAARVGLRPAASGEADALLLASRQMPAAVAELLDNGWSVVADRQTVRAPGPTTVSVSSGIDWFELRGRVRFGAGEGEDDAANQATLAGVLAAARAGRTFVELGDGEVGLLPQDWLERHGALAALGEVQGDHLRFRTGQAALLDAMLDGQEIDFADEAFVRMRRRLRHFDRLQPRDSGPGFLGSLRSYQQVGLGWLAFLRWFGVGGILADDMGLGKTIQVLAMLESRRPGVEQAEPLPPTASPSAGPETNGAGGSAESANGAEIDAQNHAEDLADLADAHNPDEPGRGPSLIVAPRSVVFNWLDEAQRFTPDLKVLPYAGPDRAGLLEQIADHDLVVTSYGLMRRDIDKLAEQKFDYVVLDEAQAIKNPNSQSAKAARLLPGRHRLALTGTPIENHLGDLWSIFEFLNPGMLGSPTAFGDLCRSAGQSRGHEAVDLRRGASAHTDDTPSEDDGDSLGQVAAAIRPFVLRRTKHQVLKDLPAKTEQTILCEMEPDQRKIYDRLRDHFRGRLINQLEGAAGAGSAPAPKPSGGNSAFMVLEALLRLRQTACHPALLANSNGSLPGLDGIDPAAAPSAKLDVLDSMLEDILAEGSKALIFSQFTSMLAEVRKRFDARGVGYAYLDGQTRNRKDVVQQFQEDEDCQVFLISLKAGGVGLNLTAAEYVFILDPWWNPAVEAQAIDRTHRIGQTRPVFAYRLICEDTVEQRVLELQQRKRELAQAVVSSDSDVVSKLTREELERLLI
ncbi:MAG: SNF2-related protein [Planctomycetota bacterium]